jgi:hypothetical protein
VLIVITENAADPSCVFSPVFDPESREKCRAAIERTRAGRCTRRLEERLTLESLGVTMTVLIGAWSPTESDSNPRLRASSLMLSASRRDKHVTAYLRDAGERPGVRLGDTDPSGSTQGASNGCFVTSS